MAETQPGPEPDTAHLLLGLPASASESEVLGAYWRLRGHVEARLAETADPAPASGRREELERLHAALLATPGVDARRVTAPGATTSRRSPAPRWLIAWATVATLLAVVLAAWRIVDPGGPNEEPTAGPPDAELRVEADPPSAALDVTTGDDDRVVLSVTADGAPHRLPEGRYAVAVTHPDCPDAWTQSVELAAGEARRYTPRICVGEGSVVVRSNATEDRLKIDGVDLGSTDARAHALRTGTHQVRVEKAGYEPWTAEVRVAPGEEITLTAELVAAGATPSAPSSARPRQPASPPPPVARATPPAPDAVDTPGGMIGPEQRGRPIPIRTGKGGSKSWHDAVMHDLVSRYDRNGTGSLDSAEEIQAIPCETWREIEQSYETGGLAVEMTHLYGFDGSDAPANTLGVTKSVRGYAYDRMKACGLKARR